MFGSKAFRACIMNTVEQFRMVGLPHIRNFGTVNGISNFRCYITNYRPLSVLFSKIFEKIVANHVIDFLHQNDGFFATNMVSDNVIH